MENKLRKFKSCQVCQAPCCVDFKQVVDLQNSGLAIFMHQDSRGSKTQKGKYDSTFIVHNVTNRELKRPDFLNEMGQFKTKCVKCKVLIKKVRSLLDELNEVKKNEVIGVCEHCKRANLSGNCRRCEEIVNKFLSHKEKLYDEKYNYYETCLKKLTDLIKSIVDSECWRRQRPHSQGIQPDELKELLEQFKLPLIMHQPHISSFPPGHDRHTSIDSLHQDKKMLENLLNTMKSNVQQYSSIDSLFVSPSERGDPCVCKYLSEKKTEMHRSTETVQELKDPCPPDTSKDKDGADKDKGKSKDGGDKNKGKEKGGADRDKGKAKDKDGADKGKGKEKDGADKNKGKDKDKNGDESGKGKDGEGKDRKKGASRSGRGKTKGKGKIKGLFSRSETVLECDPAIGDGTRQMIKGTTVVPLDPHYKDEPKDPYEPLLFKVMAACPDSDKISQVKRTPSTSTNLETCKNGVLRYELSNREFIEKGITVLPTTKIMRRINVYKMEPAHPELNWFTRHKNQVIFYDTGEILAEVSDSGSGKWFYRNGMIAMDYYSATEQNAGQRFIVYSSSSPPRVLGCFDYLGNGVVYDVQGNSRLKFNQTEGTIIDSAIGPPGRWKWHTLNDPSPLQPVLINTYMKKSKSMEDFLSTNKDAKADQDTKKEPDQDMLAIELEKYVKENANKLLQKFKPFEIRMKAMKLNDQFSLRVIDQANIYLMFRECTISMKMNLGMNLISSEILDCDTIDITDVITPYDRMPPRSDSVAFLQHLLDRAKRDHKKKLSKIVIL